MSHVVIPVPERKSFRFPDAFFDDYRDKEPDWTVEGYLTYLRTYSATITDPVTGVSRNERWWETCRRVVEGAMSILLWHFAKHHRPRNEVLEGTWAREMYHRLFYQKWSPAGRGLQHMGRGDVIWEKGAAVLNNCAFVSTANIEVDFTYPFEYLMDMSMLGVGVGFDTAGAGKINLTEPCILPNWTYVVQDTREGWTELLRLVLRSVVGKGDFPEVIDFRQVRPLGTPLKTMGGVASGPGPLKVMIDDLLQATSLRGKSCIVWTEDVADVRRYTYDSRTALTNNDWMYSVPISSNQIGDIGNIVGKCVISGGIRRTAEIILGDLTDMDFIARKQDPALLRAWRSFSNNSVVVDRDLTLEECQLIGAHAAEFGDPGIFFRHNARRWGRIPEAGLFDYVIGCNPCGEQQLLDREMCNLVETVPWRHDDAEDYVRTLQCAFLYAKLVSLLPTHRPEVNHIQERNRRVGVSMTGVFLAYEKFGRDRFLENFCEVGFEELKYFDRHISDLLGVRWSVRRTSVKPSGSVSLVLGVTSGIRAPEGEYSLKLIQFEQTSPLLPVLREAGYRIEKSVYTPSSYVVYFPVHVACKRGVDDVSAWEQIQMVCDMQRYWADNMVSNTIEYQTDEIPQIGALIFEAQTKLKSLALMGRVHGFEQAPFQKISKEQYEQETMNIRAIDFSRLHDTVIHEIDEKGCDNGVCSLIPVQEMTNE